MYVKISIQFSNNFRHVLLFSQKIKYKQLLVSPNSFNLCGEISKYYIFFSKKKLKLKHMFKQCAICIVKKVVIFMQKSGTPTGIKSS